MAVPNTLAAHPCFKTLDPGRLPGSRPSMRLAEGPGRPVAGRPVGPRSRRLFHHERPFKGGAQHGPAGPHLQRHDGGVDLRRNGRLRRRAARRERLAVTDSVVAKMPGPVFVDTVFSHRPLGEKVISTLIERLRAMSRRVGELGALDVRARVHAELLRLARPDQDDPKRAIILTPPNQSELAARINTRRETVSRELNAMERGGLIERRRGAIVITDALRLSAAIEAAIGG